MDIGFTQIDKTAFTSYLINNNYIWLLIVSELFSFRHIMGYCTEVKS